MNLWRRIRAWWRYNWQIGGIQGDDHPDGWKVAEDPPPLSDREQDRRDNGGQK